MGKAEQIVAGLGGAANIDEVEGCITRLRTEVLESHDSSSVGASVARRCPCTSYTPRHGLGW